MDDLWQLGRGSGSCLSSARGTPWTLDFSDMGPQGSSFALGSFALPFHMQHDQDFFQSGICPIRN